ncbi:MAG: hypothetical protein R3F05_19855 [Planctomycetota bacterium]
MVGVKVVFLGALAVAGFAAYDPTKGAAARGPWGLLDLPRRRAHLRRLRGLPADRNAVAETKEPDHNIPRGIYGSSSSRR